MKNSGFKTLVAGVASLLLGVIVLMPTVALGGTAATPAEAVQEIKDLETNIELLKYQQEKINELIDYYNNIGFLGAWTMSAFEDPILKDLIKESGASDDATTEDLFGTWSFWFFQNGKETKINSLKNDYRIKETSINIAKRKIDLLQMQINGAVSEELAAKEEADRTANRVEFQQRLNEVKESGAKIKENLETCSLTNVTVCLAQAFAGTTGIIVGLSSLLTYLANILFNLSMWVSVREFYSFASLPAVQAAWGIVRDICNLFFIFVLLYIALGTILQSVASINIKSLLAKVIIVALLVNFSAVLPKVIIDVSNVFASQFYQAMGAGTDITGAPDITTRMVAGFGLGNYQDLEYNLSSITSNYARIGIANLGQITLMLITAFVLVAGAFMFLFRTVVLLFLIIVSPVYFLGFAVPYLAQHTKGWLGQLIAQSLFAPVMMFMMLVVLTLATGGENSLQSQLASSVGSSPLINTLFYFIIINSMMVGSLIVASKIAASGGNTIAGYGSKFKNWGTALVAGGALGATAFAGRNFIGRGASRMADDKNLIAKAAKGSIVAKMQLQAARRVAGSSFDVRATKTGDSLSKAAGLGEVKVKNKGGYQDKLDNQVKAQEKFVKDFKFTDEQKLTYAESLEKRQRLGAPQWPGLRWIGTPRKRLKAAEKIGDLEARRTVTKENVEIAERNRAAESSNQALDLTVQQARNSASYTAAKNRLAQEEQAFKQAEAGFRVAVASGNQATIDNMKKSVETRRLLLESARKDFDELEKPIKDLEGTRKKPEEFKKYKKKEKLAKDVFKELQEEEKENEKNGGSGTTSPSTSPMP